MSILFKHTLFLTAKHFNHPAQIYSMPTKERRCQRTPSVQRKGQMFVITMLFLIGLVFFVQQLILQYNSLDLSSPFRQNDFYILDNTKDLVNLSIKSTPDCAVFSRKMEEFKDFINTRIAKVDYDLSLSYTLDCAYWNLRTSPPLNLTIRILGRGSETTSMVYMYHV
jgi:hypothetical protein